MFTWSIMMNLVTLLFVYGTVVVSNAEIFTTYPYPPEEVDKLTADYGTHAKVIKVEHKPSTGRSPAELEPVAILSEVPLRLSTKIAEEFIPKYHTSTKLEELSSKNFFTKLPTPPQLLPFVSRSLDYKYDFDKPYFVKSTATVPVPIPYDFTIPKVNYEISDAHGLLPLFFNTNSIGVNPTKGYRFFPASISNWLSPLVVKLCELIPFNHGQVGVVEVPNSAVSTSVEADVIVVPEAPPNPESILPPESPAADVSEISDVVIEPLEILAPYPTLQIQNFPPPPELIEENPVVSVEVVNIEAPEPISIPAPPELPPFQTSEVIIEPINLPVVTQTPELVENVESKKPVEVPLPPELSQFRPSEIPSEIYIDTGLRPYPPASFPIIPPAPELTEIPVVTQPPELVENVESKKPVEVPLPPELPPFRPSEIPSEIYIDTDLRPYPPASFPIIPPAPELTEILVVTQPPELVENVETKKPVEVPLPPELPPFRPSEIPSEIYIDTDLRPYPPASFPIIPPAPELTEILVVTQPPELVENVENKKPVEVPLPPELPPFRPSEIPSEIYIDTGLRPNSPASFPVIPPAPELTEILVVTQPPELVENVESKKPVEVPLPPELPPFRPSEIPSEIYIDTGLRPYPPASFPVIPPAPELTEIPVVTQPLELVENVESKKPVEVPLPPELPPFRPLEIPSEIYIDTGLRPYPPASLPFIPPAPELTEIPVVSPVPEIIETRHHKQVFVVPEPPELPLRRIPITPRFEIKSNKPLSVGNVIPPAPELPVKPLPKLSDYVIIKERINKVIQPPPELPLLPLPAIPATVHIDELKKYVPLCTPIFDEFLRTNLRATLIPEPSKLAAAPANYLPSNTIDILPGPPAEVYGPPF